MRITVKSNVYFKRLKRKKVPKLIMEQLLKPLGRAALKKVQDATSKGVDTPVFSSVPLSLPRYKTIHMELCNNGLPTYQSPC